MTVAVERVSHYRLVERLGKGAMGEVYRALDERLGRQVALKLLPHKHAGHTGWQARLLREAQAASALNHPGLVTVHDVGSWQGRVFLVMELVEGEVLSELAARGVALDEALRIVEEAAVALGAAHERGILHRDIKSANLMITTEGRVKVLDFGLAKLHEPGERTPVPQFRRSTPVPVVRGDDAVAATLLPDADLATTAPTITPTPSDLTAVGDLVGTPAYMAPEVAEGAEPDHVSEVWSLGVVLYELLVGARPFDRGNIPSTLDAVREGKPRPPSQAAPDREIPAAIDAIVARALERDPAARLASMTVFAEALRAARKPAAAIAPPPAVRRPVGMIVAGVAAVAVAGGVLAVRELRGTGGAGAAGVAEVKVTTTRRLTFDRGCEEFPSFLPDGRRLVFDLDGGGNNDLYLLDVESGERTRLTENPAWDYGAAVSPDGARVAYTHHDDTAGMLHVVALGAPETSAVSLGPVVGMPAWIDATTLVAGVPARDVVRWTIAADGVFGAPERIVTAPPTLLPYILAPLDDARLWILLRTNSETGRVALGEVHGGQLRVLDADLMDDEGGVVAHGDSVYVTRRSKAETNELARTSRRSPGEPVTVPGGLSPRSGFTISADGKRLVWSTCKATTHLVALAPGQPPRDLEPRGAWNDSYPVVVDEQRLVFSSTRAGAAQVWMLDRATGATRALTRARTTQPAISPDHELLAYADEDTGAIFVVPLDGGDARQVTDGPDDSSPAFTRDGTQLVFQRAVEVEGPRVFVAPLDGGAARALTPPGAQDPSTSRVDDRIVYLFRTPAGTVPMVTDLAGAAPTRLAPTLLPGEVWEPERTADGTKVLLLRGSDIVEVPLDGSSPPTVRWHDATVGVEAAVPEGDTIIASLVYWEGDLWIAEGEFP